MATCLYILCICYCFSHLIGVFSVTWLSLPYKYTIFIYFLFLSDEGPRLYYPYRQYTNLLIFRFVSLLYSKYCHYYRAHVWSISSKYKHRASIFYFIYKIRLGNMLWRTGGGQKRWSSLKIWLMWYNFY